MINATEPSKAIKELTKLRTKSEKLNDLFLDGNIQLEDYNDMKAKLRSNITELEGVLSTKTFKEDEFQLHLSKGLGVLKNLDNIYSNSDLNGKHKLLGSTFVEKLIFDGKKCRTGKINGAVSLILNVDKAFQGNKKRQADKKIDLSSIVENIGFEPITSSLPAKRSSQMS